MQGTHGLALDGQYNPLVAAGESAELGVVLAVRRTGADPREQAPQARAEVLLLDCSDAVVAGGTDWEAAVRDGARAALSALRPGTRFAVVAGSGAARVVFPPEAAGAGPGGTGTGSGSTGPRLAELDATTLAAASAAVDGLRFGGGPARIDRWLECADALLAGHPNPLRHVLLTAAGQGGEDGTAAVRAAASAVRGRFGCDVLGVGRGWSKGELRAVAAALSGTMDVVPDPVGRGRLAAEMRAVTAEAAGRTLGDVLLEVRTRADVQLVRSRQVVPTIERLVPVREAESGLSLVYGTGAWGEEVREYLLRFRVRPGAVGEAALLAQVRALLDAGGGAPVRPLATCELRARWTDPDDPRTREPHPRLDALGLTEPDEPTEPGLMEADPASLGY